MEMVWPREGGEEEEVPSLTSAYWRPEGVVMKVRLGLVEEEGGVAALVGGGRESERRGARMRRERRVRDGGGKRCDDVSMMVGGTGALRGCRMSTCQHRHVGATRNNVESRRR